MLPASPADPFWATAAWDSSSIWRLCLETLPGNEVRLAVREFEQISALALRACGIDLTKGKQALVQARLGRKIRHGKYASFREYYDHVVADTTGEELIALLDALT